MTKFTVITNRGAQLGIYPSRVDAQAAADNVNNRGGDVFAWVMDAPAGVEHEDIPGRGVFYG